MSRKLPLKTPPPKASEDRETVLIATLGTSPSVLTSTIWGLAYSERLIPHRIKILTTRLGRDSFQKQVVTPSPHFGGQTVWQSMCQALEAAGFDVAGRLQIATTTVYTFIPPGERTSRELDDITTQEENEQVADTMLETLRASMNDDSRLIASIAGGRKTVSALFYACMSLVGRADDRIIHVVVNEPFDRPDLQPPFYFPGQKCARLRNRDGHFVRARDARPMVINVPFVPLANLIPKEIGRMPGRFSALVAKYRETTCRRSLAGLTLRIRRSRLEIEVNDIPVTLGRREQVLLIFLAEELRAGKKGYTKLDQALEPMAECFRRLVAGTPADDPGDWRHQLKAKWGQSWEHLEEPEKREQLKGEINRANSNLQKKLREKGRLAGELASALPSSGRFWLDPELRVESVTIEG